MKSQVQLVSKISDLPGTIEKVAHWKQAGEKVVFTNGCFDILHQGHVLYLAAAANLGSKLILALNTDASVRRLNKGSERPINPESARAIVMAALGFVDAVVLFDNDTPFEIIEALQPNVVVKGGDYDPLEMDPTQKTFFVGALETRKRGGESVTIPLVDGFSTTAIIEKMRKI